MPSLIFSSSLSGHCLILCRGSLGGKQQGNHAPGALRTLQPHVPPELRLHVNVPGPVLLFISIGAPQRLTTPYRFTSVPCTFLKHVPPAPGNRHQICVGQPIRNQRCVLFALPWMAHPKMFFFDKFLTTTSNVVRLPRIARLGTPSSPSGGQHSKNWARETRRSHTFPSFDSLKTQDKGVGEKPK